MEITKQTEIQRVLIKLRSIEAERAPSMILDKGDAQILLDFIQQLQGTLVMREDESMELKRTLLGNQEWLDIEHCR